ncbi:MAG: hypothetical protein J6A83_01475 [Clostridia bacterium]|nr:hypothetical protein [Clostridia bacterium]
MKKFLAMALCVITLLLGFTSCSKPPEYSEIEERFKELIEASYEVNDILFGEGLPTYDKVYEREFSIWKDSETDEVYYYYELSDDALGEILAYRATDITFYVLSDTELSGAEFIGRKQGKNCYRIDYDDSELYYYIASSEKREGEEIVYEGTDKNTNKKIYYYETEYDSEGKEKTEGVFTDETTNKKHKYYTIEDDTLGTVYEYLGKKPKKVESSAEGENTYYYYTMTDETYGTVYEYRRQNINYLQKLSEKKSGEEPIYAADGVYYYPVEYEEKTYDFYYDGEEPEGYSYVRLDASLTSIEQIKEYAETVYSDQYLKGIYEMLFTGAVISGDSSGSLGARYFSYEDSNGDVWLMQSDKYESLIKGKRIYDFSTAKVVKPGSSEFANVEIETYLEDKPEERVTVRLSLVKQDGEWYLDNATY